MPLDRSFTTEFQSFAAADTQTINTASTDYVLVMFADLSAAALTSVDIKVGSTQVWKGFIDTTPVQLNFGKGRGSNLKDENIVIVTNGAAEIFIGRMRFRQL